MTAKCKYCKNEAEWAMQFIGEDEPTFYSLGWHVRGFGVIKVCETHRASIKDAWEHATPLERKDFFDTIHQGMLYPLG